MVKRRNVTWKDNHKHDPVLRPILYSPDVKVPDEHSKLLAEKLVLGGFAPNARSTPDDGAEDAVEMA